MNNQSRPQRSATPKRPDWVLLYKRKDAPRGTKATKFGAGWNNQFGGINLTLDRGARFPDTALCWVTMRPADAEEHDRPSLPYRKPRPATERPHYGNQEAASAQPDNAPSLPPEEDYMERKRKERQQSANTLADDDGPSFLR